MVRVAIVQESEATGEIAALYDEIRDVFGLGLVPDVLKLMSTRPDYLRPTLDLYKAMFFEGTLSRDVKETIATVVSKTNSCHY